MLELSGVNYQEVLEQGDSILVRVIASSSYRGFELSGLYCTISYKFEFDFEKTRLQSETKTPLILNTIGTSTAEEILVVLETNLKVIVQKVVDMQWTNVIVHINARQI